jgi:hypothetical protein
LIPVGTKLGASRLPGNSSDHGHWADSSDRLPAGPPTDPRDGFAPESAQRLHYRALSDAFLFTLVISGPVLLWEELWRGVPMIDQPGDLWLVPAVITVAAFFIGGAIAGRHRRRRTGALIQGVALAVPVSLLLIIADIGRRLDLHRPFTLPVAGLWLYALVGTVVISSLGSLYGRRRYLKKRARRKKRALAGR